MALFGFIEAVEFAKSSDDPRVQAMGRILVQNKSQLAKQHERIVNLEKHVDILMHRLQQAELHQLNEDEYLSHDHCLEEDEDE